MPPTFTHAPPGYSCPFCGISQGRYDALTGPDDLVYRDQTVTAFIASHWWPNNAGHVLVIPNAHYENLYDLPDDVGAEVYRVTRQVAIALKVTYGCDGISTRQHNEPGGMQDVWHYHLHVFPRYVEDHLYERTAERRLASPEERAPYAARLRAYFEKRDD